MVNMNITMPEYKPLIRKPKPKYMTFSLPCDEAAAVMQFKARHGLKPKEVIEVPNNLMLGPVPEPGEGE
jgi:hypothetical protein